MESYIPPRYGKHGGQAPKDLTNPSPFPDSGEAVLPARKYPPGFAFAKPTGFNPLPIVILILLASPYIKTEDTNALSKDSLDGDVMETKPGGPYGDSLYYDDNTYDDGDGILNILSAIHPYMDRGTRARVNTIFGLAEAHAILKKLANNSYSTSRLYIYDEEPFTDRERLIGIIRALQPFISLENQTMVNRILEIDDTIEKLSSRLNVYRQQNIGILDTKSHSLNRLKEAMDIVKIVATPEQHIQIDGIINIIRIMETIELAQIFGNYPKSATSQKAGLPMDTDKVAEAPDMEQKAGNPPEVGSDMSGNLKSLLSPEQSKSLDFIIKMARLMSQTKEDSAD